MVRTTRFDRIESDKRYYQANKERLKKQNSEWYYRTRGSNPMAIRLNNIRSRCKKDQIEFNITIEDLSVPGFCPYLGLPLATDAKEKIHPNSASVDRIDATKGYIKGNVEVISQLANVMKNNASPEQLVAFAKAVLERYC
jgi:hypothetical protein